MMYLNTLSNFLRDSFGEKLYRLSLSCADTCPVGAIAPAE